MMETEAILLSGILVVLMTICAALIIITTPKK
jgi:hypothetical protein